MMGLAFFKRERGMTNSLSKRLDRDKLLMIPRDRVASVAHALLSGANHEPPAELTAGIAVLFYAMAERNGTDPEELYHLGRKLITDPSAYHHKSNAQMESLRDFFGLRVRNEPVI